MCFGGHQASPPPITPLGAAPDVTSQTSQMLWNIPQPAKMVPNPAYNAALANRPTQNFLGQKMVVDPKTGKLIPYTPVPKTILQGGVFSPEELPAGQSPDTSKLKNYIKNFGPLTGIPLFGDKTNTPSQLSPIVGSQRTGSTAAVNIASLTGPLLPPLK